MLGAPRQLLGTLLRIAVGALFVYSSISKISHPFQFLSVIRGYALISENSATFVAAVAPWLEMFLGVCLIANVAVGSALLGIILLALTFCAAQVTVLWRGMLVSCGCFGSDGAPIGYMTILRTLGLIGVASLAWWARPPRYRTASVSTGNAMLSRA
jgi:uncharacterized membrane protein YphA (DoxX/SURF4 family)